jgi:hypothetical protein
VKGVLIGMLEKHPGRWQPRPKRNIKTAGTRMRADLMTWMQRLVGLVFVLSVLALIGAVVSLLRQGEGFPPLPIFVGVLGLCVLILLTGASMALISIAISARRGEASLRRLANQGPAVSAKMQTARPFTAAPLREVVAEPEPQPEPELTAPARPARPAGRTLVAER